MELLTPRPPSLGRSQPVFAIRGTEAATELAMAELEQGLTPQALPLLPHLLGLPRLAAAPAAAGGAGRGPAGRQGATPPRPQAVKAAAAGGCGDSRSGSDSPSYSPTDSDVSRARTANGGSRGNATLRPAVLTPVSTEPSSTGGSSGWESEGERSQQAKRARRGQQGREKRGAAKAAGGAAEEPIAAEDAGELIARFQLNEEQAAVVQHVAAWCRSPADGQVRACSVIGHAMPA